MPTLYLNEQGSTLRKEYRRFVIESAGARLAEVHEFKVERVVIWGNIQITTPALSYLLGRGIDTSFLNVKGKLKGRLAPLASKNVPLRMRQFEYARSKKHSLQIAKSIVDGKMANSIAILSRQDRNHPHPEFKKGIRETAWIREEIEKQKDLDSLRGMEGRGAAIYFKLFPQMLRKDLGFKKRIRRPPTDPVNSMLSLGYTLLYNETIGALVSVGFDPYVGFLHGINYGRCSLALDLMEEFRHLIIDRLAIRMANLEIFKETDFVKEENGGIYFKEDARRRFFKEYENILTKKFLHGRTRERTSFRKILHEQAVALSKAMMNGKSYQAFRGWR